ncbi:serine protease [Photobacterium leiognathi]|uniref:serine protease n=1 Tax=Photobacterium leiognathi TaxID=553611 RepID=UPI002732C1AC|nr:serine protease [Photobacterium leiognathi]
MKIQLWVKYIFISFFFFIGSNSYAHTNSQPVAKAINGTDVTLYAPLLLPWQAALKQKHFDSVSCGAVVISEYWLLTAAHCNSSDIDDVAIVGTSRIEDGNFTNLEERFFFNVVKRINHPDYNEANFLNDIALFRVDRSLFDVAQPIKIVTNDEQIMADLTFDNSWVTNADSPVTAIASGWGDTLKDSYPTTLQLITLAGVPDDQCVGLNIDDQYMVCADSNINGLIKDVCSGDSGGPLIWQNKQASADRDMGVRLIGLTSNGARCSSRSSNPENQYNQLTGQYTQVSTYRDWIENQIQAYDNNPNFSLDNDSLQPTISVDPFAVAKEIPTERDSIQTVVTVAAEQNSGGGAITWFSILIGSTILSWRQHQGKVINAME